MFNDILSLVAAYLIGSIPSAVWVSRLLYKTDIREHGSKNAGLTNIFRVFGWKPALPVAIIDLSKGILAPCLAIQLSGGVWLPLLAGFMVIFGHSFTCFAGFRGGKGVLTALGVFLCLAPLEALAAFGVWLLVTLPTRYVSLGSIAAALALGIFLSVSAVMGNVHWNVVVTGWLVGVFVIFKHRANIVRLLNGTENRFGSDKGDSQ